MVITVSEIIYFVMSFAMLFMEASRNAAVWLWKATSSNYVISLPRLSSVCTPGLSNIGFMFVILHKVYCIVGLVILYKVYCIVGFAKMDKMNDEQLTKMTSLAWITKVVMCL